MKKKKLMKSVGMTERIRKKIVRRRRRRRFMKEGQRNTFF